MTTRLNSSFRILRSALLCLAWLGATPLELPAATLTVTSLADSGPGTLRSALANAAAGDTISCCVTGTITLTTSS